MFNITSHSQKLYKAVATSTVQLSALKTLDDVEQSIPSLPTFFECSRVAGLRAAKKTNAFIPHCHPVQLTYSAIGFRIRESCINVTAELHAIARTGVELQAMHAVSVAALNLFALLHPFDSGIEIRNTEVVSSTECNPVCELPQEHIRVAVIVCSNAVAAGIKQESAGQTILKRLKDFGISCDAYAVIPDDVGKIRQKAKSFAGKGFNLLLFCGGTGLLHSDNTPDAIEPLLQRRMPGIMETARAYGQERTLFALFSSGVAGFIGETLVLTLPGSTRGAAETMDALFPGVLALFPDGNLACT